MTDTIITLSVLSTALATIAIAVLTKTNTSLSKKTLALTEATHELNKTIKASADQFQQDIKALQVALTAAQLYAATNPPGKPLSTQKLEEYKRIVANSL
ncbi:MAG TPA: hypothetical protein ACFYD0_16110 [Candidatus Wunengus sp. YC65]|uniref:hypothetical protein n=1 Tax=Candidatus Wunengus sp. YC65 TaxID=3367701 RepID=UPI004025F2CB